MGFESVQTNPDGREFDIFNPDIHANLIVFHFAIELLLKAFLSLKNGKLNKDNEGHRIKDLLLEVEKEYEEVREILQNQEYALLLEELGNNYTEMRYAGGTLFLRGNNKKGWKKKKPGEELAEVLHSIYSKLLAIFDEERIKPQKKGSEIALK